jgi:hypothetical protein
MSIYVKNLTINSHSDFSEDMELYQLGGKPTDLTGYTLTSHMRRYVDSPSYTAFTVGITSSTEGKINLSLTDTQTSSLKTGRYVYDILVEKPNGDKVIILEGSVNVKSGFSANCP